MFPFTTRILIADDLASLREVAAAYLNRLGYKNIDSAEDGASAYQFFIEAKRNQPYGLILSDWNMPGLTGLELLKKVRASGGEFGKTPFILMTTESEKDKVFEAVSSGVNNYIVKPLEENTLKEKMDAVWIKIHS